MFAGACRSQRRHQTGGTDDRRHYRIAFRRSGDIAQRLLAMFDFGLDAFLPQNGLQVLRRIGRRKLLSNLGAVSEV